MIHYHGTPVTPMPVAAALLKGRHACVSFADARDLPLAAEVCQSFMLDNGAFSLWTAGRGEVDVAAFAAWVNEWRRHPGFDFAIIPDVIDGDEAANDGMIARYREAGGDLTRDVPVWHTHERLERLDYLSRAYPRVALGSSGAFATVGTVDWWGRMSEAMDVVCDERGRPRCKLHGLRMLNPTVFSQLPLSSADSTNVARNIRRTPRHAARLHRPARRPRARAARGAAGDRMKALSIQQPWAWLIAHGHKPIENRTWRTQERGLILLHAGQRVDVEGYAWVRQHFPHIAMPPLGVMDVGGLVGMARLVDCLTKDVPSARDVRPQLHASPWFFGPVGFVLEDASPIPFRRFKGRLGFFEVTG